MIVIRSMQMPVHLRALDDLESSTLFCGASLAIDVVFQAKSQSGPKPRTRL
jgi:hypothetical protein